MIHNMVRGISEENSILILVFQIGLLEMTLSAPKKKVDVSVLCFQVKSMLERLKRKKTIRAPVRSIWPRTLQSTCCNCPRHQVRAAVSLQGISIHSCLFDHPRGSTCSGPLTCAFLSLECTQVFYRHQGSAQFSAIAVRHSSAAARGSSVGRGSNQDVSPIKVPTRPQPPLLRSLSSSPSTHRQ